MIIAVFVNESELASEPVNADKINIYEKKHAMWTITDTFHLTSTKDSPSLSTFRLLIEKFIEQSPDCFIIVAKKMLGATYNIFDRLGYHIWEYDGDPLTFLPQLEEKELIATYELDSECHPYSYFDDMGDQRYKINLKKILFKDPTLTSKKLLLPFLDHMTFYEIEATFSHLPPWLDTGLKKRGLIRELIDHQIDEHTVLIRKATCKDKL